MIELLHKLGMEIATLEESPKREYMLDLFMQIVEENEKTEDDLK